MRKHRFSFSVTVSSMRNYLIPTRKQLKARRVEIWEMKRLFKVVMIYLREKNIYLFISLKKKKKKSVNNQILCIQLAYVLYPSEFFSCIQADSARVSAYDSEDTVKIY